MSVPVLSKEDVRELLEVKLMEILHDFIASYPKSKDALTFAQAVLLEGNTRSTLAYGPSHLALESGSSCFAHSVDGVEYVDFVFEYSAGIYGHSYPKILQAIQDACKVGINLGGVTEKEAVFVRLIQNRFKSIDLIRFCNSGTETNQMAIGVAKVHTGCENVSKPTNFSRRYGKHDDRYASKDPRLPTRLSWNILSFHGYESLINIPHNFIIGPITMLKEQDAS